MEGVFSCFHALRSENIFFWKGSVSNVSWNLYSPVRKTDIFLVTINQLNCFLDWKKTTNPFYYLTQGYWNEAVLTLLALKKYTDPKPTNIHKEPWRHWFLYYYRYLSGWSCRYLKVLLQYASELMVCQQWDLYTN